MSNSCNSSGSSRIGYRFHPTDEEVINFLKDKVLGCDFFVQDQIAVLGDICNYEPWELPGLSSMESGDREWYFFCTPNYKYKDSERVNRTTRAGYWKVTGNHRKIKSRNGTIIGEKKTLVFYEGSIRKRNGKRTCWVIHEYQLPSNQKDWVVLSKLKKKGAEAADASSNGSQPSYESPNIAAKSPSPEDINADGILSIDDLEDLIELEDGQSAHEVSHLQPEMRSIYQATYHSLLSELQPQMQGVRQQTAFSSSSWDFPLSNDSSSNTSQNHCYSSDINQNSELQPQMHWEQQPSSSPWSTPLSNDSQNHYHYSGDINEEGNALLFWRLPQFDEASL